MPPIRKSSDRSCCQPGEGNQQSSGTSRLEGGRTDELTVNVTADSHGASDRLNVRLFDQDFSCLRREESLVNGGPPRVAAGPHGRRTLSHSRLTSFSVSCLQSDRWEIPEASGGEQSFSTTVAGAEMWVMRGAGESPRLRRCCGPPLSSIGSMPWTLDGPARLHQRTSCNG